ncbi:hypothetical protein [Pseudomaricurvus sp.]|uniref:hypothetical protein n=1 Tax=Pseudomaricurvus sp. TaxID=2004510 RepID=UPI003F6BAFB7
MAAWTKTPQPEGAGRSTDAQKSLNYAPLAESARRVAKPVYDLIIEGKHHE